MAQGDVELVTQARMGERGAMAEIYRQHRRGIGRSLLLLTHDPSAVDDLVQDTFLTAFDRLDRYSGECKLASWLHGIALNVARNHRARGRRRQGLLRRWFGGRSEASARTPERDLGERESLQQLYAVLDELPQPQREAFIVRIIDQIPLAEASEILGASVATISYRARKAEAIVRQKLEGSS